MGFGTGSLRAFDFPQRSLLNALSQHSRIDEMNVNGSLASNRGWATAIVGDAGRQLATPVGIRPLVQALARRGRRDLTTGTGAAYLGDMEVVK